MFAKRQRQKDAFEVTARHVIYHLWSSPTRPGKW
jgi:hypothetical protein